MDHDDDALYRNWLRTKSDADLTKLMEALRGPIGSAINAFRGSMMPMPVMELEARRMAVTAIKNYNPARGMGIASYVGTNVRQDLYRYVTEHQNIARIPEHRIKDIAGFKTAVTDLNEKFGRAPSAGELASHLHVPLKHVSTLQKMLRRDVLASEEEDDGTSLDAFADDPSMERVMLAYHSLSPQEQAAFDYLMGAHGKPKLKAGAIAAKLNVSPARVSALKQAIADKLKPYMAA